MDIRMTKHGLTGFVILLLVACGGGSGGGQADITYTGKTNQAVLTAVNDDSFGTAMLEGGATSNSLNPYSSVTGTGAASRYHIEMLDILTRQVKADIEQYTTADHGSSLTAATIIPVTGSCGGTLSASGNNTSGSISYNSFCVGDDTFNVTLSGTASYGFTGLVNGDFTITINFSRISVTIFDGVNTYTEVFSGTLSIASKSGVFTVSFDSLFQHSGSVFKVEGLVIDGGYISGRLYHPDFGYVDISTSVLFTKINGDYCGGTLVISGGDGSGGNVSATMEVRSDCSQYTITFPGDTPVIVTWH